MTDTLTRPVLTPGTLVVDNRGDQAIWAGPADMPGMYTRKYDFRNPGSLVELECDPDMVAPTDVAPVPVSDPRISAGKNASRKWPNKAWWVTVQLASGPRTIQADTKRDGLAHGAALLAVDDWQAAVGWDLP